MHTATLAFALTYILNHFLTYLVTGPKPASSIALSSLDVFLSQLATFILFVGLAFFGIGALTRRSPGSLVGRLGFSRPNRFQLFFAFGFAAAFQLIGLLGVFLSHLLTPGLAQNVDQSSSNLLGGLLSTPEGILFLVLTAAFGEELLFRGALQPRLGLVLTALLFTALHDQYGFSFELLSIFVLALALGWLRSRMNLWACIVAHFFFDLLGALVGTPLISLGLGLLGLAVCLLLLRSSAPRLFPIPDSSSIRWQQV